MAFKATLISDLEYGSWMIGQRRPFGLGLLPVPCLMFQPLGTKQHSLNIQTGFRAAVPQPRAALFPHLPLSQEPLHSLSHLGPFPASFVSLGQNPINGKSSIHDQIHAWMEPALWERTSDEQERLCWPHVLSPGPSGAERLIHKSRPKSAQASVSLATTGAQMGCIRA